VNNNQSHSSGLVVDDDDEDEDEQKSQGDTDKDNKDDEPYVPGSLNPDDSQPTPMLRRIYFQ